MQSRKADPAENLATFSFTILAWDIISEWVQVLGLVRHSTTHVPVPTRCREQKGKQVKDCSAR